MRWSTPTTHQLFKENDCEMTTVGNYAERIYSGGTPMTSNAAYWNGTFGWFSSGETRNRFVISTEKTITQAGIDNSSTKLATKYDIVNGICRSRFHERSDLHALN